MEANKSGTKEDRSSDEVFTTFIQLELTGPIVRHFEHSEKLATTSRSTPTSSKKSLVSKQRSSIDKISSLFDEVLNEYCLISISISEDSLLIDIAVFLQNESEIRRILKDILTEKLKVEANKAYGRQVIEELNLSKLACDVITEDKYKELHQSPVQLFAKPTEANEKEQALAKTSSTSETAEEKTDESRFQKAMRWINATIKFTDKVLNHPLFFFFTEVLEVIPSIKLQYSIIKPVIGKIQAVTRAYVTKMGSGCFYLKLEFEDEEEFRLFFCQKIEELEAELAKEDELKAYRLLIQKIQVEKLDEESNAARQIRAKMEHNNLMRHLDLVSKVHDQSPKVPDELLQREKLSREELTQDAKEDSAGKISENLNELMDEQQQNRPELLSVGNNAGTESVHA